MNSQPNVLWITLDSVRYDHTSMSGYRRETTPRLSALAETGRSFRNCFAQSNWTLGSSGALLTGTYPTYNTLGITGSTLPDEITTVPERFQAAGYQTACLSRNSYVSEATGLDRGFDRFSWIASSTLLETVGLKTLGKYALNLRTHSAGFTTDTAKHASPYLLNSVARRWLDEMADSEDPFFCYLHYNEPHSPYYPPGMTDDEYVDDIDATVQDATDAAMDLHENLYAHIANGGDLTDRELEMIQAMYDAEIRYTDEMVGRLLDFVRSLDLAETIIVVTADHGELFGEQRLLEHKLVLDDAVTNVPMVVDGLNTDLAISTEDLVEHIDIIQTIAEVCNLDTTGMHGHNIREAGPDVVISQRRPEDFEEYYEHNPEFDTSGIHGPTTTAFRTSEFKYQYSDSFDELFALPTEGVDVRDEHPQVYEDLREQTTTFLNGTGKPISDGRDAEFSDAMTKQLQDLGYIE